MLAVIRLADALQSPRYEVYPSASLIGEVTENVPTEVKLTVTSNVERGLEATLRTAEELARLGYTVVPHIGARLVLDRDRPRIDPGPP